MLEKTGLAGMIGKTEGDLSIDAIRDNKAVSMLPSEKTRCYLVAKAITGSTLIAFQTRDGSDLSLR